MIKTVAARHTSMSPTPAGMSTPAEFTHGQPGNHIHLKRPITTSRRKFQKKIDQPLKRAPWLERSKLMHAIRGKKKCIKLRLILKSRLKKLSNGKRWRLPGEVRRPVATPRRAAAYRPRRRWPRARRPSAAAGRAVGGAGRPAQVRARARPRRGRAAAGSSASRCRALPGSGRVAAV